MPLSRPLRPAEEGWGAATTLGSLSPRANPEAWDGPEERRKRRSWGCPFPACPAWAAAPRQGAAHHSPGRRPTGPTVWTSAANGAGPQRPHAAAANESPSQARDSQTPALLRSCCPHSIQSPRSPHHPVTEQARPVPSILLLLTRPTCVDWGHGSHRGCEGQPGPQGHASRSFWGHMRTGRRAQGAGTPLTPSPLPRGEARLGLGFQLSLRALWPQYQAQPFHLEKRERCTVFIGGETGSERLRDLPKVTE